MRRVLGSGRFSEKKCLKMLDFLKHENINALKTKRKHAIHCFYFAQPARYVNAYLQSLDVPRFVIALSTREG
jgi:hypothetical protein